MMNNIRDMFVLKKQENEGGHNMDRNEKYPGLGIITTEGRRLLQWKLTKF